jgi:hypothetical protein
MVPTTKLTNNVHSYMWVFIRNGYKVFFLYIIITLHVNTATIIL